MTTVKNTKQWIAPAALIMLVAVPMAAGTYRLSQLFGGAEITPANARFFASPIPVVVHIICAGVFAILGAFQFVPGFRRRKPRWHRVAGRLLVVCGLAVAISGQWMSLFYPLPEGNGGALLFGFRVLVSSGIGLFLSLGFAAIRRRDIAAHRAWMMRGYALAMGAGTQVLTSLPWMVLVGKPSELGNALMLGAGWLINVLVAEWLIRRRAARASIGRAAVASTALVS
jgi:uncharacterized membrane protein